MKRKFSMKFVLILSLITMLSWLVSNGCKNSSSDPPQTPPPQITVSSRQIANGDVLLNYSIDQTVSIQSTGSSTLHVGQIAQANPLATPFSIVSDACSMRAVPPSGACSFKVRFAPISQVTSTDSFDIPSDASNENSVTVTVSGSGIVPPLPPQTSSAIISLSSSSIDFGNVVLNNILEQTITTQNTGSANLYIGQIAQVNPLDPPFSIVSDNCSMHAVPPSASCGFKVRFSPISQVTSTNSFDVPSDASNETSTTVNVSGSGKALGVVINGVTSSCTTTGGVFEIIVNITDQTNTPRAGLTAGDFILSENGVLMPIYSLLPQATPVPTSVAMLLDYTTSLQSQISVIEAASKSFVGLLNADDEAAIIKFAQYPQQMLPNFTNNITDLQTAIDTPPTTIGRNDETRLFDALWFTVEATAARQKNKAVVVLTDGIDIKYTGQQPASIYTLDEVITQAAANGVAIYPIALGATIDEVVLNRLASETGGKLFQIASAADLLGVYQDIRAILAGQYSIKYVSSLTGSTPITLEIAVTSGTDTGAGVAQFTACP
jgi:VWFA-related protein